MSLDYGLGTMTTTTFYTYTTTSIYHNLYITIVWVQKLNKGDISKQKFIDYTEKRPFMVFFLDNL